MPWLMKAEPDSRVVKGKDVKFSVDDFEQLGYDSLLIVCLTPGPELIIKSISVGWSHEARNIMRDKMKLGDRVLFYHSNTEVPGVFAIAEVAREGYPDWSAWDPAHPYFDPKTDKDNSTWMMVDVKFIQRLAYPPTLALIKYLASISELPECIAYIGEDGLKAVKAMQLVNRGRLSVQPVEPEAYEAVLLLGTRGGWDELVPAKGKARASKADVKTEDGEEKKAEGMVTGEKKGKKRASTAGSRAKGKKAAAEQTSSADQPDVKAEEKTEIKAEEEAIPDDNRRRSKRVKR